MGEDETDIQRLRAEVDRLLDVPERQWDLGPVAPLYFEAPDQALPLVREACAQVRAGRGASRELPFCDLGLEGLWMFIRAIGFRKVSQEMAGVAEGRLLDEIRIQRGPVVISLFNAFTAVREGE